MSVGQSSEILKQMPKKPESGDLELKKFEMVKL